MKVTFLDGFPRRKARPVLDDLLAHGIDQIAIACAFCTGPGAEILRAHAMRLTRPDSFVVISSREPTNFNALEELNKLISGHLFVDLGTEIPYEIGLGSPLMHSKIFYARSGTHCMLWVGSHNLTGSASLGLNSEAAIILEGEMHEQPFIDAMQHLKACKAHAQLFKSGMDYSTDVSATPTPTLIIHAEIHSSIKMPPWYVQLHLTDIVFDDDLRPPGDVRLHLYPAGSLATGWQNKSPTYTFAGTITALNFTQAHPKTHGIVADWSSANYVIDDEGDIPRINLPKAPIARTTTQSILRIDSHWTSDEIWLSKRPKVQIVATTGPEEFLPLEPEMRRFFKKTSLSGDHLIYRPVLELKKVTEVPEKEIRRDYKDTLQSRLKLQNEITLVAEAQVDAAKKHPFIYRAKYRL